MKASKLISAAVGVLGALGVTLMASSTAQANTRYNYMMTVEYSNASSGCATCHTAYPALNSTYGMHFAGAKSGTSRDAATAALRAIANYDSDRDGCKNSIELNSGTNPADASSKPSGCTDAGTPGPTPAPTPTPGTGVDGAALYAQYCASCHGSNMGSRTASQIQTAISSNRGGMGSLSTLTSTQIAAISAFLSGTATPTPAPTTTPVPTATPTPAPTATPTPTPGSGAALYGTYCASCHGALASSTKRGRSASQIANAIFGNVGNMGTSTLNSLTLAQVQSIASALATTPTPTPTATPTPAPTATPTPAPTPTPTATGAQLYATYCQGCHGTLANSDVLGDSASKIQSAISGNKGGMGALSSLTSTQISAIAGALNGATPTPTPAPTATPTPAPTATPTPAPTATPTPAPTATPTPAPTATPTPAPTATPTPAPTATPTPVPTATPTPALDGLALYAQYCQSCHGANGVRPRTATQIQNAINSNRGGMGTLSFLTPAQVAAIAAARP